MTSRLLDLRAAVIAGVKAVLPEGWHVDSHLGRFTPPDLKKFLVTAPAVRVAVLGLADSVRLDSDALQANVILGVYVVTKDQGRQLAREDIAAAAVETITLKAMGARWGLPFAQPAAPATAQTIFNDETLGAGVAMWALEIRQPVVLDRPSAPELPDEANPLRTLWLGIAPKIGPAHRDDYIGPFPSEAPDV